MTQPCQRSEEIRKVHPASSPLNFWAALMTPAPHQDAVMGRCGVLSPKALMTTASGASVLTKVA